MPLVMLEKWRKGLDKISTECAPHWSAKDFWLPKSLEAYDFAHDSFIYISSYLTDRKQQMKSNNCFSSWTCIHSGVPQWSILEPLHISISMMGREGHFQWKSCFILISILTCSWSTLNFWKNKKKIRFLPSAKKKLWQFTFTFRIFFLISVEWNSCLK